MKEKTQYEALMEDLKKMAENFRAVATELGDILAKILPDIEIPEEKEDTWEMKCPYEYGEYHWVVYDDGEIGGEKWVDSLEDDGRFLQGNIFQTEQAALLEVKRRDLLTRFKAFRDECNDGWKPDWNDYNSKKWIIAKNEEGLYAAWTVGLNNFSFFGCFKNRFDTEHAIELFGDEIKALFVDCEG